MSKKTASPNLPKSPKTDAPAAPATPKAPKRKPSQQSQQSQQSQAASPSLATHPPDAPAGVPKLSKFQGFTTITIDRRKIANAKYNPRSIAPAQRRKLRRSIERFKLVEPLVWNKRTGNLVGGHQRLSQLDELEGTEEYSLTVSQIDVDTETEKAINIALNNPELQGQYDLDLLADVVGSMVETSPKLVQDAGLDMSNLATLFGDAFLSPEQRRQAESDEPIINDLTDMYEAGAVKEREAAKARRDAKKAAQLPESDDSDESDEQPDDDAANPNGTDPNDTDVTDPDNPNGINATDDTQRYGKAGWTKQQFKDRRKQFNTEKRLLDDGGAYLTLVFDSSDQLGSILELFGFNPNLKQTDGVAFLETFGVEVPRVSLDGNAEPLGGEDEVEVEGEQEE